MTIERITVRLTDEQRQLLHPLADTLLEYNANSGLRGMLLAQVWVTVSGEPSRIEVGMLDAEHGEQMIALVKDQSEKGVEI